MEEPVALNPGHGLRKALANTCMIDAISTVLEQNHLKAKKL